MVDYAVVVLEVSDQFKSFFVQVRDGRHSHDVLVGVGKSGQLIEFVLEHVNFLRVGGVQDVLQFGSLQSDDPVLLLDELPEVDAVVG